MSTLTKPEVHVPCYYGGSARPSDDEFACKNVEEIREGKQAACVLSTLTKNRSHRGWAELSHCHKLQFNCDFTG